jgi:ubiquinone/menaquinone biosynthesis C-methylase UbiE
MSVDADSSREHERIRSVYEFYDSSPAEQRKRNLANPGVRKNAARRWAALKRALSARELPDGVSVLDVGCGAGDDLHRIAIQFADRHPVLHGIDLLPDRITKAGEAVPRGTFQVGGAERLPYGDQQFGVVMASTVFSSVLDDGLARTIAGEMTRVTADGGVILCYDVRYPNPGNPHTRSVGRRELRRLFPAAEIRLSSLTLLPPLARRLGLATELAYRPLHALPCLRSHYLALIFPPACGSER